jgi:hypothetical protein
VPYGVLQYKRVNLGPYDCRLSPFIAVFARSRYAFNGGLVSSMNSPTLPTGYPQHAGPPADGPDKEAVLRELESILNSPFFRTSNRSKQFLAYVVQHTLDGKHEPLKERTIGAKLFQRPAGYATGDDPVVRVQAGGVCRRLEQYHHAALSPSPVRIELPVGSYAPEFRWASPAPNAAGDAEPAQDVPAASPRPIAVPVPSPEEASPASQNRGRFRPRPTLILAVVLILLPLVAISYRYITMKSPVNQFWSPVLNIPGPVLICLAKPTVYRPSPELYQRYAKSPGQYNTEWSRLSQPPPLEPNSKLTWGDMVEYTDYGVAGGDVYAALRMSAALTRMGKESQVRIGNGYSFADLRNSPAIVVGAFNNRWTMQMTSNLHFAFAEENGKQMIREQGSRGQSWSPKFGAHGEVTEDFGVVTRLLNSETGNFVVSTAGILADGTQAAAEFVCSSKYLEEALRTVPSDWTKKNLQFVVRTTVTDAIPGPPQVVATYTW